MASLTGKKIQNTYTGLLQVESGSIQDGLGNTVNLPTNQFSGSVLISSSIQLASDISGAFHHSASNLNSRMGQTETNTTNNQNAISRLTALTSSYAFTANISGSFDSISSSLASRITSNDTDITNLQSFSSSLDNTFATDTELTNLSSSLAARNTVATGSISANQTRIDTNQTHITDLTALTSSYAKVNTSNNFEFGQTISGSLIVSGGTTTLEGDLQIHTPTSANTYASQTIYINSNDGNDQVYSGIQIVDQGGFDGKIEINSYTGLDGTKPVFRLMGGNSGSKSDNTILYAGSVSNVTFPRRVDFQDTLIFSQSVLNLGTFEHKGASKITPAFFSGSAGSEHLLTGSSYDNVSLVKLDFTGSVNGTATCILPDATLDQHKYRTIRFITSASVDNQKLFDVEPSGSQLLDGANSAYTINRSYEGLMVWSDGTEWYRIQSKNV